VRYCLPSDLIAPATVQSALAAGGAVLAEDDYPLTNLHDGSPTAITRWATTASLRVIWDLGAATPLEGVLVVMHTFAPTTILTLAGNTTNTWGSPPASATVTIPALEGGLPPNLLQDLRATGFASPGYRWLSLLTPVQVAAHGIGELALVRQWRTLESSVAWPVVRSELRRAFANTTAYGVQHVVDRHVRQRRLSLHFVSISDADRDALLTLVREAGADRPFVVVLDPDEHTEFGPRADALLVQLGAENVNTLLETLLFFNVQELTLDVLEVQRGLAI
jgi:hypothetical protein